MINDDQFTKLVQLVATSKANPSSLRMYVLRSVLEPIATGQEPPLYIPEALTPLERVLFSEMTSQRFEQKAREIIMDDEFPLSKFIKGDVVFSGPALAGRFDDVFVPWKTAIIGRFPSLPDPDAD